MTATELLYPDNVISPLCFQFCPMCRAQLTRTILFAGGVARVNCPPISAGRTGSRQAMAAYRAKLDGV